MPAGLGWVTSRAHTPQALCVARRQRAWLLCCCELAEKHDRLQFLRDCDWAARTRSWDDQDIYLNCIRATLDELLNLAPDKGGLLSSPPKTAASRGRY